MGGYFYLKPKYPDIMVNYSWIPLVCLVFKYMVQTALVMPVVFALLGELFPTEIRTLAVGIVESLVFTFAGITIKLFPQMKHYFGFYGLCYFYATITVCNSIWGLISIPDNRNKSLVDVENSFDDKTPLITKK